jgi:MFS family permease
MMTVMTADARQDLLARIQDKRRQVEHFVATAVPRKRRLLNVTIVGGTLAAAFTAGPAAGGPTFTGWLTSTFGLNAPAWQILCGAAAACSVAATVSTQLLKTQNVEEHVARAQSCRAKLEVLEIGLTTGHIETAQATTEFIRCVEEVSFLDHRGTRT